MSEPSSVEITREYAVWAVRANGLGAPIDFAQAPFKLVPRSRDHSAVMNLMNRDLLALRVFQILQNVVTSGGSENARSEPRVAWISVAPVKACTCIHCYVWCLLLYQSLGSVAMRTCAFQYATLRASCRECGRMTSPGAQSIERLLERMK